MIIGLIILFAALIPFVYLIDRGYLSVAEVVSLLFPVVGGILFFLIIFGGPLFPPPCRNECLGAALSFLALSVCFIASSVLGGIFAGVKNYSNINRLRRGLNFALMSNFPTAIVILIASGSNLSGALGVVLPILFLSMFYLLGYVVAGAVVSRFKIIKERKGVLLIDPSTGVVVQEEPWVTSLLKMTTIGVIEGGIFIVFDQVVARIDVFHYLETEYTIILMTLLALVVFGYLRIFYPAWTPRRNWMILLFPIFIAGLTKSIFLSLRFSTDGFHVLDMFPFVFTYLPLYVPHLVASSFFLFSPRFKGAR